MNALTKLNTLQLPNTDNETVLIGLKDEQVIMITSAYFSVWEISKDKYNLIDYYENNEFNLEDFINMNQLENLDVVDAFTAIEQSKITISDYRIMNAFFDTLINQIEITLPF